MSDEPEPVERGGETYRFRRKSRERAPWTAERVAALRATLGLTQTAFASEIGVRQQTVSEWETGRYLPRGASRRLLGMLAESAEDELAAAAEGGTAGSGVGTLEERAGDDGDGEGQG